MKLLSECLLDSRQQARNDFLSRLVIQYGGRVHASARYVDIHGQNAQALSVELPDNVACVHVLNRIFAFDVYYDPWIQKMAGIFGEPMESMSRPNLSVHMAGQVQAYVQSHFRYDTEQMETFRAPWITAELGGGDCDDHAVVVAALCAKLNVPVEIYGVKNAQGELCHVCAGLPRGLAMEPVWLETTIPALFGEHPFEAAKRLRSARKDLNG